MPADPRYSKKNKYIVEKVKAWQSFKFNKPLTCQNKDCDGKVEPKEGHVRVKLICPKCKSVQSYVPKSIINTNLFIPAVLIKNQKKFNHFLKNKLNAENLTPPSIDRKNK